MSTAIVGFMSFSLVATVKDGAVSVTTSGDVPDGQFSVSGHRDDQQRSLSVTQCGTDMRPVLTAVGIDYKDGA